MVESLGTALTHRTEGVTLTFGTAERHPARKAHT
jgi:hypothetical protein